VVDRGEAVLAVGRLEIGAIDELELVYVVDVADAAGGGFVGTVVETLEAHAANGRSCSGIAFTLRS
jgi:hypothetical protein